MTFDVSAAARRLGIKRPVRFTCDSLPSGCVAGVNPYEPGVIKIDPLQMSTAVSLGIGDLQRSIAHELVHVAQQQEIGDPEGADWAYRRESLLHGYAGNRFEREARELEEWLAPLVKVTL